jgi:hypothetical protein
MFKSKRKKKPDNFGVCYTVSEEGPIYVYRVCSTLDNAVDIIMNDQTFKALQKDKVFIAEVVEDEKQGKAAKKNEN